MKLRTVAAASTAVVVAAGGTAGIVEAAKPKPVAAIPHLTGNTTAVKLDAGFVNALKSLKVTPAPVGKAKITSSGSAVFPITGGNVKYYKPGTVSPYVQGIIHHSGSGLQLKAGSTRVQLKNFDVNPGTSELTGTVTVNGKTFAKNFHIFFLDGRTLKPLKVKGHTGILTGTKVKLRKEAAAALNKVFKVNAFKEGFLIGVATIKVHVPG